MRIGKLRHRVTVERAKKVKDPEWGDAKDVWSSLFTTWAAVEPITGKESYLPTQTVATVSHRVTMRWPQDVTVKPTDRIFFNGRIFNIEAVLDIEERGRELQIICSERVSECG